MNEEQAQQKIKNLHERLSKYLEMDDLVNAGLTMREIQQIKNDSALHYLKSGECEFGDHLFFVGNISGYCGNSGKSISVTVKMTEGSTLFHSLIKLLEQYNK